MAASTQMVRLTGRGASDVSLLVKLYNRLALLTLNAALSTATPTAGTTTSRARTTAASTYTIDGIFKAKASTDNLFDLTPLAASVVGNAAKAQHNIYLLVLDAAGAATVVAGTPADTLAAVTLPAVPDGKCIIGYVNVSVAAGSVFTPGTTALATAGAYTVSFGDGFPVQYLPLLTGPSGLAEQS
jgi:hypothetical protein